MVGSGEEVRERVWPISRPLTLHLPNSLPLSHPYLESYSQIRAVVVNECICPFLSSDTTLSLIGFLLSREKQNQRDRKKGFEVNVKHIVVLLKKFNMLSFFIVVFIVINCSLMLWSRTHRCFCVVYLVAHLVTH